MAIRIYFLVFDLILIVSSIIIFTNLSEISKNVSKRIIELDNIIEAIREFRYEVELTKNELRLVSNKFYKI